MLMMICCGRAERGWLEASWGNWMPTSRSSSLKRVAMRKNISRKNRVSIKFSRLIGSSMSDSGSRIRMRVRGSGFRKSDFGFENAFIVGGLGFAGNSFQEVVGEVY